MCALLNDLKQKGRDSARCNPVNRATDKVCLGHIPTRKKSYRSMLKWNESFLVDRACTKIKKKIWSRWFGPSWGAMLWVTLLDRWRCCQDPDRAISFVLRTSGIAKVHSAQQTIPDLIGQYEEYIVFLSLPKGTEFSGRPIDPVRWNENWIVVDTSILLPSQSWRCIEIPHSTQPVKEGGLSHPFLSREMPL